MTRFPVTRRALSRGALLLVIAIAATLPLASPSRAAQADSFAKLVDRYLAESEARDPLFADRVGIHTYDDRLPDLSPTSQQATYTWETGWRARFVALDTSAMTLDERADLHTLIDGIDADLLEAKTIRPYATDPSIYTGAIGDAVYQLTSRNYAPLEARMHSVAMRIRFIPDIVRAAEASLTHPTHVAAQLAVQQNQGIIDLYEHDLAALAKSASPETQALFKRNLPAAVASLKDLQAFLAGPLLAQADANPRVGAALFDEELRLVDGTDTPRAVLVARARANFDGTRREMLRVARPLYATLFRKAVPVERTEDGQIDGVVVPVLNQLATRHPARDQVLATARADVADIEAFLKRDPVVPLPVPNTLTVAATPTFQAGVAGAGLDAPGPFTAQAGSYYYIDEIPASWSAQRVRSYLLENNDYEMRILSIHEAVPGHYVQYRYNALTPSLVRRVWPNGSFVEGWAVYGEGMMLDAGYRNGDPALRLFQLKWRLREYANAIIDAEFHAGAMTEAQCMQLLAKAFQEPSEAQTKWHRLQLSHDQLSSYFVGLDAIEQARRAHPARAADFNKKLLQMGSVEPRFISPLMDAMP